MLPNYYREKRKTSRKSIYFKQNNHGEPHYWSKKLEVLNSEEREFKAERAGRYLESEKCLVYSRKITNSQEDSQDKQGRILWICHSV